MTALSTFATFYRIQILIYADSLDDVLLADRERLSDSEKLEEFKLLQKVCYKALNEKWTTVKEEEDSKIQFKNRIPIHRRELFADPISLLWTKNIKELGEEPKTLNFDIEEPTIERSGIGSGEKVSILDFKDNTPKLLINDEHPFIKKQLGIAGTGKVGKAVIREIENMIVMETLFEGYLYFLELDENKINSILSWRESMYRQLALTDNSNIYGAIEEMRDASHKGDKAFENAVCKVLNMIGFRAEVISNAGKPDIVAKAITGLESYILTFEAKGSYDDLPNTKAAISAGPSHAKDYNAEHAVVIAREFVGFNKSDTPAVIKECLALNQDKTEPKFSNDLEKGNIYLSLKEKSEQPTVSIMTVENLAQLAIAVNFFQYDLNSIKGIFTTIESPDEKAERIKSLSKPNLDFDYNLLLENIYQEQTARRNSFHAITRTVYENYYQTGELGVRNFNEFKVKLEALKYVAFPFMPTTDDTVALTTTPEKVVEHITGKFDKIFSDEQQT